MADLVLNALRRNLTIHADTPGRAARIKKRISALEKKAAAGEGSTKAELLEAAAEAGVEGRSQMTKAELVEALNEGDEA